jgi:cytosine/adenosine deaminase-related metal-dependent hydrolase
MILNNLKMGLSGDPVSISITGDRIAGVSLSPLERMPGQLELNFSDALVFPGLINSHDHLDFNLFPALGDRTYKNYTEWGRYIHQNYADKINRVLKVPLNLREQWGMYKNLLNGVTTVVNHGKKIKELSRPISIYEGCQSIHSVQFEKRWVFALNSPFKKNITAAIHTGEGIDKSSAQEIDKLISRNLLKRELVGIHGVAMSESQAEAFKALVWCPESNYFLLNRTASINLLKKRLPILFGTDSTLTGDWNLWEHIRRARKTKYMTDQEIFDTLTINAAKAWNLDCGEIAEGRAADIVIAKAKNNTDGFFGLNPEDILMVIHQGHIRLFDEELYPQLKSISPDRYSRVYFKDNCKYVTGNLPVLMQKIRSHYPSVSFPVI